MTLADLVPWTRERVAHLRSQGAPEESPFLAFPLPCEVEGDETSARFEHGVLTVVLPKAPSARPQVRRIDVQA